LAPNKRHNQKLRMHPFSPTRFARG